MAQAKTAKQKYWDILLKHLADWDNNWPNRDTMAKICKITPQALRNHLSPEDFAVLEADGLELRLRNASIPRANAYDALTKEAATGNVPAIKELFDRTEGKVKEKKELTLKAPPGLNITFAAAAKITDEAS